MSKSALNISVPVMLLAIFVVCLGHVLDASHTEELIRHHLPVYWNDVPGMMVVGGCFTAFFAFLFSFGVISDQIMIEDQRMAAAQ